MRETVHGVVEDPDHVVFCWDRSIVVCQVNRGGAFSGCRCGCVKTESFYIPISTQFGCKLGEGHTFYNSRRVR